MTISSHRWRRFACCCDSVSRSTVLRFFGVAVAAVALLSPSPAGAQTTYWNAQSGDWSDAAYWTAGVPTSGSIAYIGNGGTVTITQTEACSSLELGGSASGTLLLNGGGLGSAIGGNEYVGYDGPGTFTQSGGTNTVSSVTVNYTYNSLIVGYYNVGQYNLYGPGVANLGGLVVGDNATGNFTQFGGSVAVNFGTYIGYYAAGTYNLDAGLLWAGNPAGDGNGRVANWEYVGAGSAGTVNQSGGTNQVNGWLNLGTGGGHGTYNLGAGLVVSTSGMGVWTCDFYQSGGTDSAQGGLTLHSSSVGEYDLNAGLLVLPALTGSSSSFSFNFGGGTLQSAGPLTVTTPMTLTGNGGNANVDTTGGAVTFAGQLFGPGGLNKLGAGALTLSGSNAYSGGTTVSGGTLQIGNGGTGEYLASPSITMSNNATVEFNHADTFPGGYGGTISGSGQFVKAGSGSLTLNGAGSYTGATTISGGTLALGGVNGPGYNLPTATALRIAPGAMLDLGGNAQPVGSLSGSAGAIIANNLVYTTTYTATLTVSPTSGATTFAGNIVNSTLATSHGNVALALSGGGKLTLSGSNSYSGGTTVSGGTLKVANAAGSATGSGPVTVDAGATLSGSGVIAGPLEIAGELGPGDSTEILTVNNQVIFEPGSKFNAKVAGTTAGSGYDQLKTTGPVSLSGSLNLTFGAFTPAASDILFLVNNTGSGLTSGTFQYADKSLIGMFDGYKWYITYEANDAGTPSLSGGNDVAIYAVPEPATLALLGVGAIGLVGCAWQRRSAKASDLRT